MPASLVTKTVTISTGVDYDIVHDGQHFFGVVEGRNLTGPMTADEAIDWGIKRLEDAINRVDLADKLWAGSTDLFAEEIAC